MRRSRLVPLAIAAALLALPSAAAAHAELVSSSPADGSTLTTPPGEVVLTFDDELDPDKSSFTLTDAGGDEVGSGEVDLEVADRNILRGSVDVSSEGVYTVTYAAAAADGHLTEGTITFTYGANAAPNTAMPLPGTGLATLLGVVLLLGSFTLGVREVRR